MMSLFINHIRNESLFKEGERILLAVSGGIDSVCMQHLFKVHALNYGIAHCNFQLRAEDSEQDEQFVKAIAESNGVPFYSIRFNTEDFAKQNKLSIQMAARTLRYEWFEKIRASEGYAYIATAHHKNDAIETILINMIRGTGLRGLHGILPKNEKIIRPLLIYSKAEIEQLVNKAELSWREDVSNTSTKYLRNKVRLEIIPALKEINPNIETQMNELMLQVRAVEPLLNKAVKDAAEKNLQDKDGIIYIDKKAFSKLNTFIRYELFKPYGFNSDTIEDLLRSVNHQSGACFFSDTHRILLDRNYLLLTELNNTISPEICIDQTQNKAVLEAQTLTFSKFEKENHTLPRNKNVATLDYSLLKFPLRIRKWKAGDRFIPLGMKGEKKLSDFFIDEKFSIHQKENTFVIVSGTDIVYVIGARINDRYKITDKTNTLFQIEIQNR